MFESEKSNIGLSVQDTYYKIQAKGKHNVFLKLFNSFI